MNYEEERLQRQLDDAESTVEALRALHDARVQPAHYLLLKERGYSEAEIEAAYAEVET